MDMREYNVNLNIDANDIIKTLGLEWNLILDEFQCTTQIIAGAYTKRKILSAISILFDPLGLIDLNTILTVAKFFG